jgi:hypothetical protein
VAKSWVCLVPSSSPLSLFSLFSLILSHPLSSSPLPLSPFLYTIFPSPKIIIGVIQTTPQSEPCRLGGAKKASNLQIEISKISFYASNAPAGLLRIFRCPKKTCVPRGKRIEDVLVMHYICTLCIYFKKVYKIITRTATNSCTNLLISLSSFHDERWAGASNISNKRRKRKGTERTDTALVTTNQQRVCSTL